MSGVRPRPVGRFPTAIRRLRLGLNRSSRFLTLSQRFLLAAVVVVALAMFVLGNWISYYLQASISRGVAASSASTIDSLIANTLQGIGEGTLSPQDQARLNRVFRIGNDADSTRLLQIRILALDGSVIFESLGGLIDPLQAGDFATAAGGEVVSSIRHVPLEPVGPLESHSLAVLRIYTPLHRPLTDDIFGVAVLYYSAKSVLSIQLQAQFDVWVLVGLIGIGVIAVLYVLVDRASRTIARQRSRLARNLQASRRLSEENHALHAASEQLRLNANSANESLLNQVGSDIHDGPIQLLTLIILRLSKAASVAAKEPGKASAELRSTIQLATDAMEELRNISTGLVLPELTELSVGDAIQLAISRHEEATGTSVRQGLQELPAMTSTAAKICAYRVVQEALNNAFRHGDGSDQSVAATADGSRLVVEISNANPDGARLADGEEGGLKLGLRGMRFRVESLGGVLRVDMADAARTTIHAEIPLAMPAS